MLFHKHAKIHIHVHGHHKIGPYIMILYFCVPVPSVLAMLITGVGIAVPIQIQ